MYVFNENTLRQSKANTKRHRASQKIERTRDQDDREEPAAQEENGTRRLYDGAEDTGVNHIGKINSRSEGRRKNISRIPGNMPSS